MVIIAPLLPIVLYALSEIFIHIQQTHFELDPLYAGKKPLIEMKGCNCEIIKNETYAKRSYIFMIHPYLSPALPDRIASKRLRAMFDILLLLPTSSNRRMFL